MADADRRERARDLASLGCGCDRESFPEAPAACVDPDLPSGLRIHEVEEPDVRQFLLALDHGSRRRSRHDAPRARAGASASPPGHGSRRRPRRASAAAPAHRSAPMRRRACSRRGRRVARSEARRAARRARPDLAGAGSHTPPPRRTPRRRGDCHAAWRGGRSRRPRPRRRPPSFARPCRTAWRPTYRARARSRARAPRGRRARAAPRSAR